MVYNVICGFVSLHLLVLVAVVVRVLQRPHRAPASRIAWLVVVLALPVIGIVAYLMLGETHIGRRNQKAMLAKLGEEHYSEYFIDENADESIGIPSRYVHLFRVGRSISNFAPVAGNSAQLMRDSAATIDTYGVRY